MITMTTTATTTTTTTVTEKKKRLKKGAVFVERTKQRKKRGGEKKNKSSSIQNTIYKYGTLSHPPRADARRLPAAGDPSTGLGIGCRAGSGVLFSALAVFGRESGGVSVPSASSSLFFFFFFLFFFAYSVYSVYSRE